MRFEGPLGSFFLREDSEKPMIFVAGSTGFAPVKSMLEYAFSRGVKRRMLLYWGVRRPADLYLRELPEKWAREHANFSFVPVISHPAPEDRGRAAPASCTRRSSPTFPTSAATRCTRAARPRWWRRRTRRSRRRASVRTTAFPTLSPRAAPGDGAPRGRGMKALRFAAQLALYAR